MAFNPLKNRKPSAALAEEQPSDVRASLDRSAQLKADEAKMQAQLVALRAGQDKEQLAREEENLRAVRDGDDAALADLDNRSLRTEKKIERIREALKTQAHLIIEEDKARYALKAQHIFHGMGKLTNKGIKRAARLQAATIEYVESTREMFDIGEEIGAMLLGFNLHVGDTGTSQKEIVDFIGHELARLHPIDGTAYKVPMPGAIHKAFYGVPLSERRSLLQEFEVRAQHILASVKAGPHPKTAAVRPPDAAAPLPVAAANLIPAEVTHLNGVAEEPEPKGVTAAVAMALMPVKTVHLTAGGKDPANE